MSTNNTQTIKQCVDSSFAVHKDMKSHTSAIMTINNRAIISDSTQQKVNARSSTESNMVTAHNTITKVLQTKHFIEAQGHKVKANIVYQNNTSAIILEMSDKASSGKRTRHFDIEFFYFTDLINKEKMQVEYCPTSEMISNHITKQ